jgi:hypothetical protein
MCVSMSDKPFDAEACDIGGQASASNGLSDMKTPFKTHRVIDPKTKKKNRPDSGCAHAGSQARSLATAAPGPSAAWLARRG